MPVSKPAKNRVYLAGPFFNPAQLDLINQIENLLVHHEIDFYSPRLHGDNVVGKITNEMAQRIFKSNVDEIAKSTLVLAVLDWKMPAGERVVIEKSDPNFPGTGHCNHGPLNLPDTGTVFEMGLASQMNIPILGFTERDKSQKLNIMLTQACRGVCHSLKDLSAVLNFGDLFWELAPAWTGVNE